jgi:hypothetical protein
MVLFLRNSKVEGAWRSRGFESPSLRQFQIPTNKIKGSVAVRPVENAPQLYVACLRKPWKRAEKSPWRTVVHYYAKERQFHFESNDG